MLEQYCHLGDERTVLKLYLWTLNWQNNDMDEFWFTRV